MKSDAEPNQRLLCVANVQHNCAAHNCGTSNTAAVRQERHATTFFKAQILHNQPSDVILNTARMRDAIYFQHFRLQPPSVNMQELIMNGCMKEVDQRKQQENTGNSSRGNANVRRPQGSLPSHGRGRGRGRGRG